MTNDDVARGPRNSGAAARSERLAAALKANLKKRKDQARARGRTSGTKQSTAPPGDDNSGD